MVRSFGERLRQRPFAVAGACVAAGDAGVGEAGVAAGVGPTAAAGATTGAAGVVTGITTTPVTSPFTPAFCFVLRAGWPGLGVVRGGVSVRCATFLLVPCSSDALLVD